MRASPTAAVTAQPLTSVMMAGDSTALTLAEGMKAQAAGAGLDLHDAARFGCTIVLNYHGENTSGQEKAAFPNGDGCDFKVKWPPQLAEWSPKAVMILFGPLDTADHLLNGHWMREGTPEWTSYYNTELTGMVNMLRSAGAQVIIATVPQYHHTPDVNYPNPTYNDPRRIATLNEMYENFAAAQGLAVFDLPSFVQPSDFGPDGVHFSPAGAARLAAFVDPVLKALADPSPGDALPPGLVFPGAKPVQMGPGAR